MSRSKSLNFAMAVYVLLIMLSSGVLTSLFFVLFYSIGVWPFIMLTPILSPLVALFVSSIIGTSISALANERMLKPMKSLIRATDIVATGDFSVRVEEQDGDSEMAKLLRNFNHMVGELGGIEMFRDDFINNFSHELKTPLVSIRGFAKQLRDEEISPEKRREYTDIIIRESERLASMSASILLLARLENQRIVTDRKEYDLDEQLRSCVILLEKKWSARNIEFDLRLAPVRIHANAELLSHVWINLLDNAIKYSREGGRVTLSCGENEDEATVTVRDDGEGMDAQTLKHAFDKFFQGDRSHSDRGNGLGLSIALRVVELCEGRVGVRSEPGTGTAFTVRLPTNIRAVSPQDHAQGAR